MWNTIHGKLNNRYFKFLLFLSTKVGKYCFEINTVIVTVYFKWSASSVRKISEGKIILLPQMQCYRYLLDRMFSGSIAVRKL